MSVEYFNIDFLAYYVAAKSYLAGLNPYLNNGNISPEFCDYYFPYINPVSSRFLYPPMSLFIVIPFTIMPYVKAKVIWAFFQMSCLIGSLILLRKLTSETEEVAYGLFVCLIAVLPFYPLIDHSVVGQINILLFFLFCVFIYFWLVRDWAILSALFFSIAVLIKVWPIIFLLPLALLREWKRISMIVLFLGFWVLLSLIIFGKETNGMFLDRLFTLQRVESTSVIIQSPQLSGVGGAEVVEYKMKRFVQSIPYSMKVRNFSINRIIQQSIPDKTTSTIIRLIFYLIFLVIPFLTLRQRSITEYQRNNTVFRMILISYFIVLYLILGSIIWAHYYVFYLFVFITLIKIYYTIDFSKRELIIGLISIFLISTAVPYLRISSLIGTLMMFWLLTKLLLRYPLAEKTFQR